MLLLRTAAVNFVAVVVVGAVKTVAYFAPKIRNTLISFLCQCFIPEAAEPASLLFLLLLLLVLLLLPSAPFVVLSLLRPGPGPRPLPVRRRPGAAPPLSDTALHEAVRVAGIRAKSKENGRTATKEEIK